ncbi:hypothetical protein GCM10007939_21450 [Amylibacter marinus]|uniref:Uncharacterized protein n=1 Tax=Amylibacter marinus TaxID=1475483 RepID=A0ABQ5VXQ7_9RHOB|nr:hypothetical protein [Amylibacter marinus]GLQ35861.1 hypothetical protein GCM10007939_21450 [Amylibacter marinus]
MSEKQPIVIPAAITIGVVVSMIWAVLVVLFFLISGQAIADAFNTPLVGLLTLLTIILPLVLIWTVAVTAGTAQKLKSEAKILRRELGQISQNLRNIPQQSHTPEPTVETAQIMSQLKLIAEMTVQNDKRLQALAKGNTAPPEVLDLTQTVFGDFQTSEDEVQIALPFSATAAQKELPPMPVADLIKAINFPNGSADKDGFRALRRAMEDRKLREMLDHAQRVMSMLTSDGIFMDDLSPDRPVASAWRDFAKGARGKSVTTVGGARDKAVLAITRARMKTDPDFREHAHYFLQMFDRMLFDYEPQLKNHEITDLADTRSARVFMILARIGGAFD